MAPRSISARGYACLWSIFSLYLFSCLWRHGDHVVPLAMFVVLLSALRALCTTRAHSQNHPQNHLASLQRRCKDGIPLAGYRIAAAHFMCSLRTCHVPTPIATLFNSLVGEYEVPIGASTRLPSRAAAQVPVVAASWWPRPTVCSQCLSNLPGR